MVHPLLDLRRRQIELAARLRHSGLALDDLQYQRRLAPRRPTLDFLFHHHAHGCLLRKVTPEQEITGSLQNSIEEGGLWKVPVCVARWKCPLPITMRSGCATAISVAAGAEIGR